MLMWWTMRKNKSRTNDLEEGRSGVRQRSDMRIYFTMIRTDVYKKSIFEESFKLHLLLSLGLSWSVSEFGTDIGIGMK